MLDYQREFIEFALQREVLRFGEFKLKSGRLSPYFFNSGLFNDGACLKRLGEYYRFAIERAQFEFDMLFGPAYKGIPLASAVAIAFAPGRAVPYCFDRKEEKDHGEGGLTLGAPLAGRVLIVDDVITAGTSATRAITLIEQAGARAAGMAIALDRQERGTGPLSAVQEMEQRRGLEVISVITLADLIEYLQENPGSDAALAGIRRYREAYGVDTPAA